MGREIELFDGRQITAARALAGLSVAELARAAEVTKRTVHRLEIGGAARVANGRRHGFVSRSTWERIIGALARHGVELVAETGRVGSGVRWTEPRKLRGTLHAATGE